jgi:hypothetical protein
VKEVFCGTDRNSNRGLSLKASEDIMLCEVNVFWGDDSAYNKTVTSPDVHGD